MNMNGITEGLELEEAIAVVKAMDALNGLNLRYILAFVCWLLDTVYSVTKMSEDEVFDLISKTMKRGKEKLDV